mgnify:CR=1 FL=1
MIQLKFKDKEIETEFLENLKVDLKNIGLGNGMIKDYNLYC